MNERVFTPPEAEQFHPDEQQSVSEAHEEAKMVRELMGNTKDATPQDYDNALKTLEELKKAAANEPTYKKVALKILRGATTGTINVLSALTSVVGGYGTPDSVPDPHMLVDASRKLTLLKERADERAEKEKIQWRAKHYTDKK